MANDQKNANGLVGGDHNRTFKPLKKPINDTKKQKMHLKEKLVEMSEFRSRKGKHYCVKVK